MSKQTLELGETYVVTYIGDDGSVQLEKPPVDPRYGYFNGKEIVPPEGWELVPEGEKVPGKHWYVTSKENAEFLTINKWDHRVTTCDDAKLRGCVIGYYRPVKPRYGHTDDGKKIVPPVGWEIVPEGEETSDGDRSRLIYNSLDGVEATWGRTATVSFDVRAVIRPIKPSYDTFLEDLNTLNHAISFGNPENVVEQLIKKYENLRDQKA